MALITKKKATYLAKAPKVGPRPGSDKTKVAVYNAVHLPGAPTGIPPRVTR